MVVGAGAMGTAAARSLAARGRRTLVLERFRLGHANGSSHGPNRIFRLAYHHPDYVRMARLALEEWRALEAEAGQELLVTTGGLDAGIGAPIASEALSFAGEPFEWLDPEAVAERWPALAPPEGGPLLFQGDAGVCRAAPAVAAQARLARELGATILEETPVRSIAAAGGGVEVVTAGAEPLRARYALPVPDRADTVKLGEHQAGATVDPDEPLGAEPAPRNPALDAFAAERFPGSGVTAVETCVYTNTPDEDFVLDRRGPVVIGSPCSGHGFKFAPLIGRILADLATGEPPPVPLEVQIGR